MSHIPSPVAMTTASRGVYELPYTFLGKRIAVAIASDHDCKLWLPFSTDEEGEAVAAQLWAFLDEIDPPRQLLRVVA